MQSYKRSAIVRFKNRHARSLHWLAFSFVPGFLSAVLFGTWILLFILQFGKIVTSDHAADLSCLTCSSPLPPSPDTQHGTPGPVTTYASMVGQDLYVVQP